MLVLFNSKFRKASIKMEPGFTIFTLVSKYFYPICPACSVTSVAEHVHTDVCASDPDHEVPPVRVVAIALIATLGAVVSTVTLRVPALPVLPATSVAVALIE